MEHNPPLEPWQLEIEDYLERESADRERQRLEQVAQQKAELAAAIPAREAAAAERIKEWAREKGFVCRVCGKESSGPLVYPASSRQDRDDFATPAVTNWDLPADLKKCNKGDHWAHPEHMYKGICKGCPSITAKA